jgi:hypothetical protein
MLVYASSTVQTASSSPLKSNSAVSEDLQCGEKVLVLWDIL